MNYWVKKFISDKEIGTDKDIKLKKASWSNGRLDNMVGAELHHNSQHLYISGIGNYWQSDTYEVLMYNSTPKLVSRRIEKQITNQDLYFKYIIGPNKLEMTFNTVLNIAGKLVKIESDWINKWLVAEMDVNTHHLKYYISDKRK